MSEGVPRIRVPVFEDQVALAVEALRGGHLVTGPHLERLAQALAERFGRRHVVLASSAFAALFATLKALGVEGRAVALPGASTCFAMPNAVRAAGGRVEWRDVEPDTASLPPPSPEGAAGVVVAPDHFGRVARICGQALPPDVTLIEDAAQAFLSVRPGPAAAAATILSFYPTKIANGAGGGAVLTDDDALAARVGRLVDSSGQSTPETTARHNLSLCNLHAAVLLGTLRRMDEIERGLMLAHRRLAAAAERAGLRVMPAGPGDRPTRMILFAESEAHRDRLIGHFGEHAVQAARELLLLADDGDAPRLPVACRLVACTLSVPLFPLMTEAETSAVERSILTAGAVAA